MNHSTDELNNKEPDCSQCDDSGLICQYDKNGSVINMPCPRCTEDVMSHVRSWEGRMFDG